MRGEALRWRNPSFALRVGLGAFVVLGALIALVQGVHVSAPSQCQSVTLAPLRALPWVLLAFVPFGAALALRRLASRTQVESIALGKGPYRAGAVPADALAAPRRHAVLHGVLAVIALAVGALQLRHWSCPYALPASCHPRVDRIVLVPVGPVDHQLVDDLAKHFRDCYGLPVMSGAPVQTSSRDFSEKRGQWTAEKLMTLLPACEPNDVSCSPRLLIGITDLDIYSERADWNYAFGTRDPDRNVALLSTFRMSTFGRSEERASKMIAKDIALEYCGLSPSQDPDSIRYQTVLGNGDLDAMDESVW